MLAFVIVLPLIMSLLGLLGKSRAFAVFPFLGAIVSGFAFLGLGVDGDITTQYSGTQNVLLSASTTSFTWEAIVLIPLFLTIINFLIAGAKAVNKL